MTRQHALLTPAIIFTLAPAAVADSGPLLAELVTYEQVRRVIPADVAERFAAAVDATPQQRAAAADLVAAAREDLARVVNTHLRTVRDDPTLAQIQESEARVLVEAGQVERRLRDDLASLLSPERADRAAAFERALRRTLLRGRDTLPLAFDVFEFLARQGIDTRSDKALAEALQALEIQQDAALIRERRGYLAYIRVVRMGYDASPESAKRNADAQRELYASDAGLRQAQSRLIQRLMSSLDDERADRLAVEIVGRSGAGYDATCTQPRRYPVLAEVQALALNPEQKAAVRTLIEDAEKEVRALCRRCVTDQAAFELMDNKAREKVPTAPTNVFFGKAVELRARVSAAALALLTPAQRSVYDASPVVDPADSSRVEPEP